MESPVNMTKTARRLEVLLDKLIERKDIHSAVLSVASGDGAFRWAGAVRPSARSWRI